MQIDFDILAIGEIKTYAKYVHSQVFITALNKLSSDLKDFKSTDKSQSFDYNFHVQRACKQAKEVITKSGKDLEYNNYCKIIDILQEQCKQQNFTVFDKSTIVQSPSKKFLRSDIEPVSEKLESKIQCKLRSNTLSLQVSNLDLLIEDDKKEQDIGEDLGQQVPIPSTFDPEKQKAWIDFQFKERDKMRNQLWGELQNEIQAWREEYERAQQEEVTKYEGMISLSQKKLDKIKQQQVEEQHKMDVIRQQFDYDQIERDAKLKKFALQVATKDAMLESLENELRVARESFNAEQEQKKQQLQQQFAQYKLEQQTLLEVQRSEFERKRQLMEAEFKAVKEQLKAQTDLVKRQSEDMSLSKKQSPSVEALKNTSDEQINIRKSFSPSDRKSSMDRRNSFTSSADEQIVRASMEKQRADINTEIIRAQEILKDVNKQVEDKKNELKNINEELQKANAQLQQQHGSLQKQMQSFQEQCQEEISSIKRKYKTETELATQQCKLEQEKALASAAKAYELKAKKQVINLETALKQERMKLFGDNELYFKQQLQVQTEFVKRISERISQAEQSNVDAKEPQVKQLLARGDAAKQAWRALYENSEKMKEKMQKVLFECEGEKRALSKQLEILQKCKQSPNQQQTLYRSSSLKQIQSSIGSFEVDSSINLSRSNSFNNSKSNNNSIKPTTSLQQTVQNRSLKPKNELGNVSKPVAKSEVRTVKARNSTSKEK